MRQKALESIKLESKPAQKYQPPQFLSKEVKLIKSPKKRATESLKSQAGEETTKRMTHKSSVLTNEKNVNSQTVIKQGGFSAAAEAIMTKHVKQTASSLIRVP